MMTDKTEFCTHCGQLLMHNPTYDEKLWDIYHRIRDGRSSYEPLIFTSEWLQENIVDDEDHDAMMHAMEKDMYNRGLCIKCGRPDLRNVKPEDVMSEEEAQELHDMWAEQASERRAGC